jgi:hypothetical protein
MKLKDKFKIINCKDCDMPYCDIKCTILAPSELIKLEKVADDFAIGFAEWCADNYFRMGNTSFWAESLDWDAEDKLTTKELLEIYKKEKGL